MKNKVPAKTVWTIGHSTRTLDEFISILKSFRIQLLADVRSYPGSRRVPHFNKENLEKSLPENEIEYIHMKDLGGRRKVDPASINTGWKLDAFRGYADYMATDAFKEACAKLEDISSRYRTAYMCAEALWWSCHRSLISDYLKLSGWNVIHIMGGHKSMEHEYTKPARIADGKLYYSKD